MNIVTVDRLRALLSYDSATGVFTWRRRADVSQTWNDRFAGGVAGSIQAKGYRYISIDARLYRACKLAWLYVHGEWPSAQIDHENGDGSDDRIGNLRLATNAQNCRNQGPRATNKSGRKGVWWNRHLSKWQAKICVDGRGIHLGVFTDIDAASAAYAAAAAKHHGEFARTE